MKLKATRCIYTSTNGQSLEFVHENKKLFSCFTTRSQRSIFQEIFQVQEIGLEGPKPSEKFKEAAQQVCMTAKKMTTTNTKTDIRSRRSSIIVSSQWQSTSIELVFNNLPSIWTRGISCLEQRVTKFWRAQSRNTFKLL